MPPTMLPVVNLMGHNYLVARERIVVVNFKTSAVLFYDEHGELELGAAASDEIASMYREA